MKSKIVVVFSYFYVAFLEIFCWCRASVIQLRQISPILFSPCCFQFFVGVMAFVIELSQIFTFSLVMLLCIKFPKCPRTFSLLILGKICFIPIFFTG